MDFINDLEVFQKFIDIGYFEAERDDGRITQYSYANWLGDGSRMAEGTKQALEYLRCGKVLDVGCGSGLYVEYLNKKGFSCTGIDLSEPSIKYGQSLGRSLELKDFWKMEEKEKFDSIILMGSTIPFLTTPETLPNFFEKCDNLLNQKGRLLLTSLNWPEASDVQFQQYIRKNQEAQEYPGKVKLRIKIDDMIGEWFVGYYYDLFLLTQTAVRHNYYPVYISYDDGIKYNLVLEKVSEVL